MPSKETWGYINRGINGQGSVSLNVYSFVNSYKKGDGLKATADLTSSLHNLMGLAVNNHATDLLGRAVAKLQLAAIAKKAYTELKSSGSLSNQTVIDLSFAIVGVATLGLSGATAFAVASVGLGVGVLSLLQDGHKWNDGAAIWNTDGTEIFDTVIGLCSDENVADIFEKDGAFAVAQLLKNIDASIDNARIEEIFDEVSISSISPESVLNIVGDILDIGDTVLQGDTDALYTRLANINQQVFPNASVDSPSLSNKYKGLKIVDTASLSSAAQSDSAQGYAYRYALVNLNSIAITGDSSLYSTHNKDSELDADSFSEQNLSDRSDMLDLVIGRNINDRAECEVFLSDENRLYQDLKLDETVSTYSAGYQYDDRVSRITFGTEDDDLLTGDELDDHMYGAEGNDALIGDKGADYLEGNSGNDNLDGGCDTDTMFGGEGNDVYVVDSKKDIVSEEADAGVDMVKTSISYTLLDNFENLQLIGELEINATGNALTNVIAGNHQANELKGMGGNDYLFGGYGNDILRGGAGADLLVGGYGYDIYYADNQDTIYDVDGEGLIVFNGNVLDGGLCYCHDPQNIYRSGTHYYQTSDCSVTMYNGCLCIIEYSHGDYGFDLTFEEGPFWPDSWATQAESYRVDIDPVLNDLKSRVYADELMVAMATFDYSIYEMLDAPNVLFSDVMSAAMLSSYELYPNNTLLANKESLIPKNC